MQLSLWIWWLCEGSCRTRTMGTSHCLQTTCLACKGRTICFTRPWTTTWMQSTLWLCICVTAKGWLICWKMLLVQSLFRSWWWGLALEAINAGALLWKTRLHGWFTFLVCLTHVLSSLGQATYSKVGPYSLWLGTYGQSIAAGML